MTESQLPSTYCVVGGGPSGLIAARALRRYGVEVDVYERHPTLGGMWNSEHPGSPVYDTCNFISDRDHSGFIGYRMDARLSEYPTWREVRDYIHDFADRFGLTGLVRCGVEVTRAEPISTEAGTYWRVQTSDGASHDYRGVVWACGQQQSAYQPTFPGQESFPGRLIHSSAYQHPREFLDQRVLVVGAGNSGVDIACDAAHFGRAAALSVRRGYWFMPKRLFGRPTAFFYDHDVAMPPGFPALADMSYEEIRAMIASTVGDVTRLGLPAPDHPIGATHPVVNDQVLHQLAHGWLTARPNIDHFDGSTVHFVDGSSGDFDVVVLATGYTVKIPWLDPRLIDWNADEPDLHLGTFSRQVDGLYAVGLLHFPGHTYGVWDQLAQLMAADAHATLTGERADALATLKHGYDPDLRGGKPLLDVHRNLRQVDTAVLGEVFEEIRTKFGIPIPGRFDPDFYTSLDPSAA